MRLNLKTVPTIEPVTLDEAKLHLRVDGTDDNVLIASLITSVRKLVENETEKALITQTWQLFLDKVSTELEIPKSPLQSVVSIKTISSVESYVDETSAVSQAVLKVASTSKFAVADTVIVNRDGAREEGLIILTIQDGVSLTMTTNLTKEHTAALADRVEKYNLVPAAQYMLDASNHSPGRVKLRTGHTWPTHRGFASFIVEFKAGYGDAAKDVPDLFKQVILQLIGHFYENRGGEGSVKARVQALDEARVLLRPYRFLRI